LPTVVCFSSGGAFGVSRAAVVTLIKLSKTTNH
jgi:hypothetical protein